MRNGMWSAAGFVLLLSAGLVVLGGRGVQAADGKVDMVEGSQSDPSTWKFAPEEITVPVGSKVVWTNKGKIEHTATAKGVFDSKYLKSGGVFEFTFTAPGDIKYVCEPHESLGMIGVVHVVGDSTPTTATTQPAAGATTTTTATAPASGSTSTTARAGTGGSTTTTTAGAGVTSTTQAPSVTPTSAPDTANESTTTTAPVAGGEESAADHGSEGGAEHKEKKNSPIGIAFASISTLLLAAIAGKLLASKP